MSKKWLFNWSAEKILSFFWRKKKFTQALHIFEQLVEKQKHIFGENHAKTISTKERIQECKRALQITTIVVNNRDEKWKFNDVTKTTWPYGKCLSSLRTPTPKTVTSLWRHHILTSTIKSAKWTEVSPPLFLDRFSPFYGWMKKKRFSRNGCFFSLDFFWVICMIGTVCILMWLIYIYIIFYYFNKNTIFFIHLNVPTRVPIYYILLF